MNHLAHGGWEAGPGFVTGCQKPVIVLDKFTNWNPFPDERNGIRSSVSSYERVNKGHYERNCKYVLFNTYLQVFYAGCADSDSIFMYWVLNKEVQLTWIKYQMPINGSYHLMDACLCPGMSKLVAGTNR